MRQTISLLMAGMLIAGCSEAETPQNANVVAAPVQQAQSSEGDAKQAEAAVRQAMKKIVPTLEPDSVTPSELKGFYEVVYGPDLLYVSDDGRYLIQGDVFDLTADKNITEAKRAAGRRAVMAQIDESQKIIFAPENPKYKVTVFTDVDCTYCRRLHSEINNYTDKGIAIEYVFSPRSQRSLAKAISVWCADDQKAAMSQAKKGQPLPQKSCDNPIALHTRVANEMGISGTPMIVLESGQVVNGYVPADRLLQVLESQ